MTEAHKRLNRHPKYKTTYRAFREKRREDGTCAICSPTAILHGVEASLAIDRVYTRARAQEMLALADAA